jgi:hypothetical protein
MIKQAVESHLHYRYQDAKGQKSPLHKNCLREKRYRSAGPNGERAGSVAAALLSNLIMIVSLTQERLARD